MSLFNVIHQQDLEGCVEKSHAVGRWSSWKVRTVIYERHRKLSTEFYIPSYSGGCNIGFSKLHFVL